jgi:uncharacterized membrane protein YgdD (TMEM256/DUF423 family)
VIERIWIAIAGLSGALAVGVEAVVRHHLAEQPDRLVLAGIGGRYGLAHAVALLVAAALAANGSLGSGRWLAVSGWCFTAGLVLFCGSLYLLALGAPQFLAWATPVGGLAFIAGWLALAVAALAPRPAR